MAVSGAIWWQTVDRATSEGIEYRCLAAANRLFVHVCSKLANHAQPSILCCDQLSSKLYTCLGNPVIRRMNHGIQIPKRNTMDRIYEVWHTACSDMVAIAPQNVRTRSPSFLETRFTRLDDWHLCWLAVDFGWKQRKHRLPAGRAAGWLVKGIILYLDLG